MGPARRARRLRVSVACNTRARDDAYSEPVTVTGFFGFGLVLACCVLGGARFFPCTFLGGAGFFTFGRSGQTTG